MTRVRFVSTLAALWVVILSSASPTAARGEEPFRKTLISISKNFYPDELLSPNQRSFLSSKAAPTSKVPWSVRMVTLHGGKQEGVDLVIVDNGALTISVIPTRGMGILSVRAGDVQLGWDSPVVEVVHPKFINLQSRGGLGWLEGFSEWLCRCGMESNGHPGTDRIVNKAGEESTMELTLHGRVANLPAQELELVADREPPFRITLRGRVDERMFHGPKLELYTEISTEPGTREFRVRDVVSNRGGEEQEFQMLYHINFGPPLLEDGSTFLAPLSQVTAFNEHAAKDVTRFDHFGAPTRSFVEQVYCLRPRADSEGNTMALIRNKAGNRGASIRFSTGELPYLTVWKNTAAKEDGYVTGIEPGTNFPNNRRIERMFGRVPKLAPGASHAMTLDFAVQVKAEEVAAITNRINVLQGNQQSVVDEKPQKKE
jgi:Domain of unknown function (DUF4432)